MRTAGEALAELAAAIRQADGFAERTHTDLGVNLIGGLLPAAVIGVPDLSFGASCRGATGATFTVYVVADQTIAIADLADACERVAIAIEEHSSGTVDGAEGGVFLAGRTELPCYQIPVEFDL